MCKWFSCKKQRGIYLVLAVMIMGFGIVHAQAERKNGYIPPRIIFPMNSEKQTGDAQRRQMATFYDAREEGLISPVKDQGWTSTCWAYTAMSGVETAFWKKDRGEFYDFSEMHLVYNVDEETDLDSGGSVLEAMAYFSRLDGPVLEGNYAHVSEVIEDPMSFQKILPGWLRLGDIGKKKAEKYVGDMIIIGKEEIKTYVKQYGGVCAAYRSEVEEAYNSEVYYDNADLAYHLSSGEDEETDHIVLIVGWDDLKQIKNL